MKITVISSSLRRNGNSEMLADEFIRGAKESGNEVEKITLGGKKINFCIGCLSCQKTGKCVIKDDCAKINEKIHDADVLVFATPIYIVTYMKNIIKIIHEDKYYFMNF